ncbi:MAG: hypothetical protein EON47_22355 [Acetobacteraceae bacterium]|nr:MAG: hypothetical protein EON47_22355 [Acetobacteraceae bacterium]
MIFNFLLTLCLVALAYGEVLEEVKVSKFEVARFMPAKLLAKLPQQSPQTVPSTTPIVQSNVRAIFL